MSNDNNNCLFSQEEMERMEPNSLFNPDNRNEPVTCLGITFDSEDARREYFREELRKKLPELKQIEGFPIGEDDDIINLSDPPYYTACPNPWLNDFIEQWEKEKVVLEKKGKRKANFEVKAPYASDVSEGKNNPIYMAHAYHTKVPHPAIMRYILHYTQPGDIVFDGFCGTGMTGVAAQLCGSKKDVNTLGEKGIKVGVRHAICSDLSPIASLISANYNLTFDVTSFSEEANNLLRKIEDECGWLYTTDDNGIKGYINYTIWSDVFTCPNCGKELIYWDNAVDIENSIIHDEFSCPHCGTSCSKKNLVKVFETVFDSVVNNTVTVVKKKPVVINYTQGKTRKERSINDYDDKIIDEVSTLNIRNYIGNIPDGDESSRNYALGLKYTHQLFTYRNYVVLTRAFELAKGNVTLTNWITSVIQNASKMYKFRLDRKGGIVSGTLFIPSLNIEQNVLKLLKAKIRDFLSMTYDNRLNTCISILSATCLKTINNDSVDYIFTDPPFGSNIMYSELSSLWEGWIKVKTNIKEEAIINRSQNKSLFDYQTLINNSLKEYYRILKPGKWMTLEFSNTSASVWNSIQNALQGVGFIVVNVAALDKKQGSFKAVTTTTAVKQDLVITCYKPSAELTFRFEESIDKGKNAMEFTDELLRHLPIHIEKDNSTVVVIERNPKILYDRLISYYVQHGFLIPMDAQEFQKELRECYIERDGMFFTATQAAEYDEKKKNAPEFVSLGIFVSDEASGIQWLKNQLRDTPKTYQEIQPDWMQAINGLRKNDILPELKQILEENFIEMEGGKWRLPNIQDDVDKEALRTKLLLREFKKYVEVTSKPKAKIKEARVEALRAGFKQCYIEKDFKTIVLVGDKIPQNLRDEDETLLQFYDIAVNKM